MSDTAQQLLDRLKTADKVQAEIAARALKHLAKQDRSAFAGLGSRALKALIAARDLRVQWNLIVVLRIIELRPQDRLAAIDWLWERLNDPSSFTRTYAMQALWTLSLHDPALRRRLQPYVVEMKESGTPALRARARCLLAER